MTSIYFWRPDFISDLLGRCKTSVLAMVPFLGEASNEIRVSMEFREVLTLQKKSFKHTRRDRDTHTETQTLYLCPCYIITLLG